MNTPANAVPEVLHSQRAAPATMPAIRLMYWSLRRELWEYRSLYIAPVAVAALALVGIAISHLPSRTRLASAHAPGLPQETLQQHYVIVAGLIMASAFLVALYYCMDALQGERRDRSILFWKSLPVSDVTTVLSKATIALALPLYAFAVTVVTQLIMLLLSSAIVAALGMSVATLWAKVSLSQMLVMLLYHLVTVHMFWYAPIYAWLLLVSAWARRATFLWVVLPPLAIGVVEKIAFNTSHFANWVGYRFSGPQAYTFTPPTSMPMDPMMTLAPIQFFSTPGLWIGLAFAAAFLAAAAWVRRYRGPI